MEGKTIRGHNMKLKRGIAAMLLTLSLAVSLLPARVMPAQAASTGKSIVMETNAIQDPTTHVVAAGTRYYTPNSYIYFGVNSGNNSTPIKWRVLKASRANDGSTGMFLLSEYVLDTNVYFDADKTANSGQTNPNEWQNSDAQSWCTAFASNTSNFTTAEQSSMLGITKNDSAVSYYSIDWSTSNLTTSDKLFFLSAEELVSCVGNYQQAPGLKATGADGNNASGWWLRSRRSLYGRLASAVDSTGNVIGPLVSDKYAARPAFNLSLDSVLFTSAAEGGKASGTVGAGALTSISTYDGNEWKLTLLDNSRSFAVTETSATAGAGDTITLTYTGATVYNESTAPNEYISVILSDGDGIQYYGRVLQPTGADGTVDITIPSDLALGTYTLNVFSEQYNGDYRTDYASAFDTVTLTVTRKTGSVTITSDDLSKTYDGNAVGTPTYSALSSGEVTVKYKRQDADDTTYTTVAPKDAGEYTVLVTVAGDSTYTEASATADFTIYPKELTVTVNDVIKKYGDDNPTFTYTVTDGKLAKGDTVEDLGITLSTVADKDSAVGSYAITGTSDSTCYDVTVIAGTLKVVTLFALPEQDFPDDGADHMLAIEVGLSEVPEVLRSNPNLDTVEEIEALLKTVVCTQSGYSEDHTVIYDVTLMVSFDGGLTWVEATEDNFPADGLTVILPYPDGTSKDTHDFTVTHMFTKAAFGKTPGETETPSVTKTDDGIQVTVTGLSPIIIAWKDVETEVTTTDEAATSVETGDYTFLWLLLALMGMSGCLGIYFVAYCKKEGK